MGKLILIRHCTTDYNLESRYQGKIDIPLNKQGISEAENLILKLNLYQFNIGSIITSPLLRCKETTEIINKELKLQVNINSNFSERGVGIYEGLTRIEAERIYPDLWSQNITRQFDKCPLGGETINDVIKRVFPALDIIKNKNNKLDIILVSHGFISKVINKYFFKDIPEEDFFKFEVKNGEYKIFEF